MSPPLSLSSLEGLDWPALCEHLARFACFGDNHAPLSTLGVALAMPPADRDEILALTSEMLRCLVSGVSSFDFVDVKIRELQANLRLERLLAPVELLAVRRVLEQSQSARSVLAGSEGAARRRELVNLVRVLESLEPDLRLAHRLAASVDDQGAILDSASPALREARMSVATAERRLVAALEGLLKASSVRDALQDPVWMEREGRYVLPVRTDRKTSVEGTTIGVSQSGATLFIEPLAIAGQRSALESARREEQIELHKVLSELSLLCRQSSGSIQSCCEGLLALDRVRARAIFAQRIGGTCPELHQRKDDTAFDVVGARHPLFVLEGKRCVAHDFSFAAASPSPTPCVLILSGPNAGGKTVTMKLLGLMALMAREGLFVPADRAKIFAFDKIHAAIGDSQSLHDDLSTFSSHLKAVLELTQEADHRTLVLLDEGFVGTDPSVGAALARAVLEQLAERRVCTIITTHFSPLKSIADENPLFLNASMEFEHEALRPTYRLLVGVPGQSYALELAARMGFSQITLERARDLHGREAGRLEKMLAELQVLRTQNEKELATQKTIREQLESDARDLQHELGRLHELRESFVGHYSEKLQKRLNAFRNALEIRERQFVRQRQDVLDSLRREHNSNISQEAQEPSVPTTPRLESAESLGPVPRNSVPRDATKKQPLKDFSDLARVAGKLNTSSKAPSHSASSGHRKWLSGAQWDDGDAEDLLDRNPSFAGDAEALLAEADDVLGRLRDEFEAAGLELAQKVDKILPQKASQPALADPKVQANNPPSFAPGRRVRCKRFKGTGTVLGVPSAKGLVPCEFKGMKTKIPVYELELVEDPGSFFSSGSTSGEPSPKQQARTPSGPQLDVQLPPVAVFPSRTVDLRGREVDVALERLDLFVDKVLREDMPSFVILHGHGTGAVKKAVRKWLAQSNLSCRYRPGTAGEGGDGVTVVVLQD